MRGTNELRVWLLIAGVVVGCEGPHKVDTATPNKPAAPKSTAPPEATALPDTTTEPDPVRDTKTCRANTIVRAGLDEKACAEAIAAVKALPAACTTDAQCQIHPAAGGCLGVGVAVDPKKKLEPMPRSCGGDCWSSTFDDHHVGCRDGCCSIYEE